ncbi:hypothetical protein GALL_537450 [mine drainage metagenome]|uniref:Uncharacterized protein n=1 Tax=mine drainage metagenome TaxID=410659 RepID=A0A1J5P252_9ZZZZ
MLFAGNRVGRHETQNVVTQMRLHVANHIALGRSDIGDDRFTLQVGRNGGHGRGQRANRCRQNHHVGTLHGMSQVGCRTVDDPHAQRQLTGGGFAAVADHFIDILGTLECQRNRAAHQPATDNGQAPDALGRALAHASATGKVPSTLKKPHSDCRSCKAAATLGCEG